jgi:hypothetical protein
MIKAALATALELPDNGGSSPKAPEEDVKTSDEEPTSKLLDCMLLVRVPGLQGLDAESDEGPRSLLARSLVVPLRPEDDEKYTATYDQTIHDVCGWKAAQSISAGDPLDGNKQRLFTQSVSSDIHNFFSALGLVVRCGLCMCSLLE